MQNEDLNNLLTEEGKKLYNKHFKDLNKFQKQKKINETTLLEYGTFYSKEGLQEYINLYVQPEDLRNKDIIKLEEDLYFIFEY